MRILAVDTSTLTGSVAILDVDQKVPVTFWHQARSAVEGEAPSGLAGGGGDVSPYKDQKVPVTFWSGCRLVGELTLSISLQHSERLMPAIERLLVDANMGLDAIDLFAVSHGPGSFTGIRIGLATIQGLAFSQGKPVIGVSSLEALAMHGYSFAGLVVPMLDARRNEIYGAAYRWEANQLKRVVDEVALPPETFLSHLNRFDGDSERLFIGSGAVAYRGIFEGNKGLFPPEIFHTPRAALVGLLAARRFQTSSGTDSSTLVPHYLRTADTTFPRKRAGSV